MCACFKRVNEKLKPYNGILESNLIASEPRVVISVCKLESKKHKKPPVLEATWCPFCGERYTDNTILDRVSRL